MTQITFKDKFCAKEGLAPEKYSKVVLSRALYPMARLLRCVLWISPGYFAPDRLLVEQIATITSYSDFEGVAQDFIYDPANRGFLRQKLNLRLSVTRLRRLVRGAMQ